MSDLHAWLLSKLLEDMAKAEDKLRYAEANITCGVKLESDWDYLHEVCDERAAARRTVRFLHRVKKQLSLLISITEEWRW